MQTSNENILEFIRHNWAIILFLGSLIVIGVRFESNLNDHEGRLKDVEVKTEINADNFNDVREQLAAIRVTLDFIKSQLTTNSR